MNKRPLTTIVMLLLRGAFPVALLFIGINMIRFAQAQPQSNKGLQPNAGHHTTIFAVPTAQRPSLKFTIVRNERRLRRHNKTTASPVLALHRVLFVAWSPVQRTVKSPLTPMVGR